MTFCIVICRLKLWGTQFTTTLWSECTGVSSELIVPPIWMKWCKSWSLPSRMILCGFSLRQRLRNNTPKTSRLKTSRVRLSGVIRLFTQLPWKLCWGYQMRRHLTWKQFLSMMPSIKPSTLWRLRHPTRAAMRLENPIGREWWSTWSWSCARFTIGPKQTQDSTVSYFTFFCLTCLKTNWCRKRWLGNKFRSRLPVKMSASWKPRISTV